MRTRGRDSKGEERVDFFRLADFTRGRHARHLWAIVLAGRTGISLRRRVSQLPDSGSGEQDSRTLLGETLDRIGRLVPPERTVVVTLPRHSRDVAEAIGERSTPRILVQPKDRGTAAGVLFPVHWIHAQDRHATVLVFPSEHFIREGSPLMVSVAEVAAFLAQRPDWIVLLGAQPTEPEPEFGWIEPGERVGWTARAPVYRVRRFRENPSRAAARVLFAGGSLWNTFVFGAQTNTLIEAGRECVPGVHDPLARISTFMGTQHEPWAIERAFALTPTANFSRSILEACPHPLAVSKVPELSGSDPRPPGRRRSSLLL
jgi:mannose-1-phosphate guanylyltransferase